MSKKIKIFLLGCALMLMCCIGITVGAAEETKAKVIAHNLTITDGGINVNFYVEMQGDVEVTLNGSTIDNYGEEVPIIVDAKVYNCYKFTQPVVAKRMDEKVSLIIESGDKELVNTSYSVNDYVDEVTEVNSKYSYNLEKLAEAMTYYGEFSEVYFVHEGKVEAEQDATTYLTDANVEATAFTNYGMQADKDSMASKGLTYKGTQLNLNSEITLRILFEIEDSVAKDGFVVKSGDTEISKTLKKVGNYYCLDIENIGADALDKAYTITYNGEDIITNCSALSYAKAVVEKYANNPEKANLVNVAKALYLYNQKADAYVESQKVAVYDIFYGTFGNESNVFSATPDEFIPVYLTSNDDVTTESTENQVTTLSQLNDSRTKGCSVWMKEAYTPTEEVLAGPYVIRRYAGNTGNVLNVTGTATFETTVDGSLGKFVAQYPGGTTDEFEISNVENGDIYVSGALTVKGSAKSGLITTSTTDITITADGLTEDAVIVFPDHKSQKLAGTGEVSAIQLEEHAHGHFGAYETAEGLSLGSIICGCGANISQDPDHSCGWTDARGGLEAAYALDWKATTSIPTSKGSYYLTSSSTQVTATFVDMNGAVIDLDLAGYTIIDSGYTTSGTTYGMLYRVKSGTLNIADSSKEEKGKICMVGDRTYGGISVWGTGGNSYVNVFGGTLETEYGTPIAIRKGYVNMEGGTILPGAKAEDYTYANAVQVGIGNNSLTNLNVSGGTIKGEVFIQDTSNVVLSVTKDAQVGIKDENQPNRPYGIKATDTAANLWTINCEGLTDNATVVLENLADISITGNGDASAIEFKEDGAGHFGAYETEEGLMIGSIICGCGANISQDPTHSCGWVNTYGLQAAYDIDWKEWTETTSLPTSDSYYLTKDIDGANARYDIKNSNVVNLDLAGCTVEGTGDSTTGLVGLIYRVQEGTLNIADSSKEQDGAIYMRGETNDVGAMAVWNYDTSCMNIFGGTISAKTGPALAIRIGQINMYGGTILPGAKPDGNVNANAVQIGTNQDNKTYDLNVFGGIIKGEVLISKSGATVDITGDAQVGIKENEQSEKPYGIGTADTITSAQTINFSNTSGNVVLKDTKYLALAEGATGDASKFTIIDKHNQVVNVDESETLGYAAYMCVCGKTDGRYDHTDDCEQPAYAWEPWTSTTGLPTDNGSFYLTQNLTGLTTRSNIGSGNDINLDLAGYTVEGTGNGGVLYRIQRGSLNLADSSEEQKGAIRATGESDKFGRALYVWGNEGSEWNANIFGGTLSAEKGVPVTISRGNIHMYGGKILAGTSVEYSGFMLANSVQVGLYTGASANLKVAGGTITGEVLIGNETSSTVAVSDDAQVGIEAGNDESGNVIPYGIGIVPAVTSTQTINCDGITADASVVIQNLDKVGATGTGEGSAFTVLETSRNQIADDSAEGIGNLVYEAYMCVCGKSDGKYDHTDDCRKPAYAWEPWTSTTGLPTNNGSFYLTQNLTGLTTRSTIGSGYIVNLDLAGYTVDGSGTGGILYRIQRGGLNLADSSEEKTGKIYATGESTGIGRALYVWGNEGKVWYANIFGGTLTAETSVPVAISNGNIHMYGGTIEAGTSVEYSGTTLANSVQVGLVDGTTPILNVEGGTITGEVLLGNNNAELKISDNAKVAIADDDANKAYGIGTTTLVTTAKNAECDNVSADANVVIKNLDQVGVTGTGEASSFTVLEPSRNTIIDDNDDGIGTLGYEAYMCVCGEKDGEYDHHGEDCGKPESAWLPWTSTTSLPTEEGSYYLTTDIAVSAMTTYKGIQVNLDLAGHTVKGQTQDTEGVATALIKMMTTGKLNITDTVGGGVIKNACQVEQVLYGTVIQMTNGDQNVDACVNLFAGTLTSAGATCIEGIEEYTVRLGVGTFNMYGGAIEDNLGEADNFKAVSSDDYKWEGGTVFEDGVYVKGGVANVFRAGYGKTNINPDVGVSLGSYGNEATRTSTGVLSNLEAIAIAVTDEQENTLILVVTDLSWGRISDANAIREEVYERYGIPKENVLVGGTHNHSAPSAKYTTNSLNVKYMKQWKENVLTAIGTALRDRAEATLEVGRTETENMVFSRRYKSGIDGKYMGGGPESNNETEWPYLLTHESEADEEIQMLRFVRGENAKDILITQWQSHACNIDWDRDGTLHYQASGEWPQIIRSTLEEELDVHCMYMQGAAGNLASMSRISTENLYNATSEGDSIGYNDYVAIGEKVASYVSIAYNATNVFTEVESGLIQINQYKMPVTLREKTDDAGTVTREEREATEEERPELNTVAIGNVSLVTLPSELFDTSAKYVKTNTPFAMTLIMGYTCGSTGYEAPDEFWDNGCYEVINGNYVRGTAELMMQHYVDKLTELHELYATE